MKDITKTDTGPWNRAALRLILFGIYLCNFFHIIHLCIWMVQMTHKYYLQHKINKLQHYGLSTLANAYAYIYIVNYSCTTSSSTCVHYTYHNKPHTIISSCRLSKLKCESHSSKWLKRKFLSVIRVDKKHVVLNCVNTQLGKIHL